MGRKEISNVIPENGNYDAFKEDIMFLIVKRDVAKQLSYLWFF